MNLEKQRQHAATFAELHAGERPLVLFNCWDVASAQAVAPSFPALATSSHAIAGATGYQDGQDLPFDRLSSIVVHIAAAVDRPLSVDLEAGYADSPADVVTNVRAIIEAGAIGINLEDSIVGGRRELAPPDAHVAKIKAIREAAAGAELPAFWLNARTDAFLLRPGDNDACFAEALRRGTRYAEAGANSVFVPFVLDLDIITRLAHELPVPLNVMAMPGMPPVAALEAAGVRRISFGSWPAQASNIALAKAAANLAQTGEYGSFLLPAA